MGIFGWSLPPGCGTLPGEEPTPPCQMCGYDPESAGEPGGCICIECPTCGEYGAPECYQAHGLIDTDTHKEGRAKLEELYRQDAEAARAESEYWRQHKDDDNGETL